MEELRQELYYIADEMRGMASVGKHFAGNVYEVERAHRIMELAIKVAALADGSPIEPIADVFEAEPWFRVSPAIGVDAAVFNEQGEILLIQRRDNSRWATPGGLAEIGRPFTESVVRELWEEAGLRGRVVRLLGVFDGALWKSRMKGHISHLVYQLECDDLTPLVGSEALDAQFFGKDDLPSEIHPGHEDRILRYFELLANGGTHFDPADAEAIDLSELQRPESDQA